MRLRRAKLTIKRRILWKKHKSVQQIVKLEKMANNDRISATAILWTATIGAFGILTAIGVKWVGEVNDSTKQIPIINQRVQYIANDVTGMREFFEDRFGYKAKKLKELE